MIAKCTEFPFFSQNCGCWCPGAKAPGHQRPQYWPLTTLTLSCPPTQHPSKNPYAPQTSRTPDGAPATPSVGHHHPSCPDLSHSCSLWPHRSQSHCQSHPHSGQSHHHPVSDPYDGDGDDAAAAATAAACPAGKQRYQLGLIESRAFPLTHSGDNI